MALATQREFLFTEVYERRDYESAPRVRLCDFSWFIPILNEAILREANRENICIGRSSSGPSLAIPLGQVKWEGRFTSQASLDEAALAACMAYVDLNPVRLRSPKHQKNLIKHR